MKASLVTYLIKKDTLLPLVRIGGVLFSKFTPNFLHIDEPADSQICRQVCVVQGWFTCEESESSASLQIGGVELAWLRVERPDIRRLIGRRCCGFRTIVDLHRVLTPDVSDSRLLSLDLVVGGKRVASKNLSL